MITKPRLIFIFLQLSALIALIASGSVYSQAGNTQSGFTDHALLSGFPESEIVSRELLRDVNYRIVLGGLQRTRGEVIPEHSERLRGDITKITYEVSQEFSAEDTYQFFREQLRSRNYSELFSCEGRACGSSNYWANDIFRNRTLYGPERNQFYLAFRGNTGAESEPYFALYIVTRANRRIYAHLEIAEPTGTLEPEQLRLQSNTQQIESLEPNRTPNPAGTTEVSTIIQQLRQRGSVVIPGIVFQSDNRLAESTDLSLLLSVLNVEQSLFVYLVSHLQDHSQTLPMLMQRSNTRAATVRQALISEGIAAARIIAAGAGPLAPNCNAVNCEQRVELVLR